MGLEKSEHYQNLGLDVQVLIAGVDVTEDVERLGEINTAADSLCLRSIRWEGHRCL